jgi:hypothetical protein
LTQNAYEQLNLGDEFDITSAVTNIIFIIVMAFTFGPGLPILYLLAAMNIFVTYWTHKTWLLKFYKKPPNFGSQIIKLIISGMDIAFYTHVFIGISMYN